MHEQFKNEKCAACGMKFFDDEDIVVCPECALRITVSAGTG